MCWKCFQIRLYARSSTAVGTGNTQNVFHSNMHHTFVDLRQEKTRKSTKKERSLHNMETALR
jgi:hypothetical protein